MERKIKIYCASGWFTPNTRDILDRLERMLSCRSYVSLYSPRRDGVMLPPNQKHDTELREKIFQENIDHILNADLVFANIDSQDSYNDPGTIYEVGYAMANNIPVIGFATSDKNISSRFKGILDGFKYIILNYEDIDEALSSYEKYEELRRKKVLFVGSGDSNVDNKLASYIIESGASLRWVNENHDEVYSRIDEIFKDVYYMIAVIDDRKTIVSWMIGQAYARRIPVVTYSNYNYGINVMLLISVLTHIRGTDELVAFLQQVKREGIESIPKFDVSQMDSM